MRVLSCLSTQLNVDLITQVDDGPPTYSDIERYLHATVLRLTVSHVRLDRPECLGRQLLDDFTRCSNHWLLNHILYI